MKERFESRFDKIDGCWEWKGSRLKAGYGRFFLDGKTRLAHRISYELYNGPTHGLQVRHQCDNPSCVNPEHLILGTHEDNMQDKSQRFRIHGMKNPHRKLTEEDVLKIREDTRPSRTIAKEYGITKTNVLAIRKREIWRHL